MQEIIEKIIERLEEERKRAEHEVKNGRGLFVREPYTPYIKAIEIVNQVAEDFATDTDVADKNVGNIGWIPCSERLPEEDRECWVTIIVSRNPFVRKDILYKGLWKDSVDEYVKAWQYIDEPEPYQPKGE